MTNANTLLAIETATSNCSVALQHEGRIFSRDQNGNNVHSQVVLEMVEQVLEEGGVTQSQIEAVAVGQGPGSFTGLRIGVGVAQGLAYGVGCQMIGVASLDALANMAEKDQPLATILAGIDARMGEIYWCEYRLEGATIKRVSELMVTAPEAIEADNQSPLILVGNAWNEYSERFPSMIRSAIELASNQSELALYPSAESVLQLANSAFESGELISPIDFAPEYVRNNVAKKSTKLVGRQA